MSLGAGIAGATMNQMIKNNSRKRESIFKQRDKFSSKASGKRFIDLKKASPELLEKIRVKNQRENKIKISVFLGLIVLIVGILTLNLFI